MGSTVPSFSPSMDFIQSIDIDSIKSFAGDFKASFSFFATDLVEAFAEGFSPSVDFIRSMDYSIKAFAEDFNSALDLVVDRFNAMRTLFSEKYEALAASTYKLFDEKYEASIEDLLSDPFGVLAAQSISSAPAVTGNLTGSAINLGTIEDQQIIRKTGGGFTMSAVSLDFIIEESGLDWKPASATGTFFGPFGGQMAFAEDFCIMDFFQSLDYKCIKPIKAFAEGVSAKSLDFIQWLNYKCIKPMMAFADDVIQAVPLQPVLTLLAILFAVALATWTRQLVQQYRRRQYEFQRLYNEEDYSNDPAIVELTELLRQF